MRNETIDGGARQTLEITYLTAPACRLCEHGHRVLAEMSDRFRLVVREVDMLSDEGRGIVARARIPFPPAVLVDGQVVAHGRLSRQRLEADLERIAHTPAAARGS
jgi:hypothetical protein